MSAAFAGSHFILSHPLRKPLVSAAGERVSRHLFAGVARLTLGIHEPLKITMAILHPGAACAAPERWALPGERTACAGFGLGSHAMCLGLVIMQHPSVRQSTGCAFSCLKTRGHTVMRIRE